MDKIAIIINNKQSLEVADTLRKELNHVEIFSVGAYTGTTKIDTIASFLEKDFNHYNAFVFIGALGICVRSIAPFIQNKQIDPAIINMDVKGQYVQSVLSGHKGGANHLAKTIANISGGTALITTASDTLNLWALDIIGRKYKWTNEYFNSTENDFIAAFVNGKKTALLLDIKDEGSEQLERTLPDFVEVFYEFSAINPKDFDLIIALTPKLYETTLPVLFFRPKCLHLGTGAQKNINADEYEAQVLSFLEEQDYSKHSLMAINTVDLKKDETAYKAMSEKYALTFNYYGAEDLNDIDVDLLFSEAAHAATGANNVSEASALLASSSKKLLIVKSKHVDSFGKHFTLALAMDVRQERKTGFVTIVGAGPGDPELVSVKGKKFLQNADLILYAGSLVPRRLTEYAKEGCVVRNSASMTLEEQFDIMHEHYKMGHSVVRLHTGDPCIYGAIQEQMNFFDHNHMSYEIVPGISSFQAAAARLKSQFTIPDRIQTIILTRGEGRTAMPDREKLTELAKFQSTICLFLSATLVDQVQADLLSAYPPETPIAVCYKLTWQEEKIWRGKLKDLAKIVKENELTLTTMIVVGEAIDNRKNRSKLYDPTFRHIFREKS
jgi:precorrin-4 C11-methyltransferase